MARSPFNMIVASCLAVIYGCASLLSLKVFLILVIKWSTTDGGGDAGGDDDDDSDEQDSYEDQMETVLGAAAIYAVIKLILNVILFIATILLMVGINKESHRFVAPTIYLTPVDVVLNLALELYVLVDNFNIMTLLALFVIVIQVALWIPMLLLYIELRKPRNTQPPESRPLNTGYNAYPAAGGVSYTTMYYPPAQPTYASVPPTANYNPAPNVSYPVQQTMVAPPPVDQPPNYDECKGDALPGKN